MSGTGLGNQQRITLARIARLGDNATHEALYQAGMLHRRRLGEVIKTLHKRGLIEDNGSTKTPYKLTPFGQQAKDAMP